MNRSIAKLGKQAAALAATIGACALPMMAAAEIKYSTNLNSLAGAAGISTGGNNSLVQIIGALIGTVLVLLGVLLVVFILWAGFIWMTSQGEAGKTKKAKDMIYQSIIGLLIIFAAYAITNFVFSALTHVVNTGSAYTGTGQQ